MTAEKDEPHPHKSWFERLSAAFHHEPTSLTDIRSLLRESARRKILDIESLEMLEGVLNISKLQVRDIMIPRAQIVMLELNKPMKDILPTIIESAHSRFPVVNEDKDDVIGILLAKDLLKLFAANQSCQELTLTENILRPAVFIPESKRLDTLLHEFKSSHNHLAVVVDVYGGIAGVVTIEDVLEEIVGEIEDEYDTETTEMIQMLRDDIFQVDALTPVEMFNNYFNTSLSNEKVDTIGGYVTQLFGHLPKAGEEIYFENLTFTITTANVRRIEMLKVERALHENPTD